MTPFLTWRQTLCFLGQIFPLLSGTRVSFQGIRVDLEMAAVWTAAAVRCRMAVPFHPNRPCEHNPADSIGI